MHLPRNELPLAIIQEIDSASNDQSDCYGFIWSPDMDEVFDGAAKRTEDFVFGLGTGSQQEERESDEMPNSLNLFGSGG